MHRFVIALVCCVALLASIASADPPVVVNVSTVETIRPLTFDAAGKTLAPVKLAGARNGAYAEQLAVVSSEPIKNLKIVATELKGPGVIPASAVRLRYAIADGPPAKRGETGFFDSLEESAPAETPILPGAARAIQPIWVSVEIPSDARPGDYAGKLTVKFDGSNPFETPLQLHVSDWALPPTADLAAHMDIVESPESVAMAYDVELWSDAHFKLLDKTFSLLAPLAAKTVYVTAVRRTHFGNEHAMIRWVADDEGNLTPDFGVVEKYLDIAARRLGKIPAVILYCWEPVESMGHAGGAGGAGRTTDRPAAISVWNSKTGEYGKRIGPAWGTPESKEFWKKLTDGIKPLLAKRGLEQSMLLGLIGDARPTQVAMDDISNGVAGAKWAIHSHFFCDVWKGYPVGFCNALWGIHLNIVDPSVGYGYGWQNPFYLSYYPREMNMTSSLIEHRWKLEMWVGAFSLFEMKTKGKSRTARGLGRIGGDFWLVAKDSKGRVSATLAGRYPESYWGQLNLNYCISALLGKGSAGPVATIRSEAFRHSIQDVEARVFIEKAILDDTKKAALGDEMVKRCRALLDERIRVANRAGGVRQDQVAGGLKSQSPVLPDDWRQRNQALYDLVAEVAGKLKP